MILDHQATRLMADHHAALTDLVCRKPPARRVDTRSIASAISAVLLSAMFVAAAVGPAATGTAPAAVQTVA